MKYENSVSSVLISNLLEATQKLSIIDSTKSHQLDDITLFLDPENRVSETVLFDLWDFIDKNTRVPSYGLLLGQYIETLEKGLLTSLLSQCESFGDALDNFITYQDWGNPSEVWNIIFKKSYFEISLSLRSSNQYSSAAITKSLTNFIHLSRKLCDFQLVPISSTFSFEKPDYHILFDATFGNNLTFCGNKNALKFDISFLDINLKTYNPYIKSLLIKKIIKKKNSHIKKMQKEKIINKSVIYDLISLNLKDRNANINTISSSLSTSRQTLHRHLKQEHTSFKKILSEVRMNKSLELLSDQSLTTTKVSEILGYNEISSFYSAFKIWHGFTVSEFKKTMLKK